MKERKREGAEAAMITITSPSTITIAVYIYVCVCKIICYDIMEYNSICNAIICVYVIMYVLCNATHVI